MATTQYIGARYVPIFANPAEWNNTRTYEPLTIVMHEGNSYTSRQYVPKGIDIADETFWALTGNYNAQVEAYRKDVIRVEGEVSEEVERAKAVEAALENTRNYKVLVCPDDFEGANDTEKFNAALAYAHENATGVCLKKRTYTITSPLTFYRGTYIEGNGATIVADGSFSLFLTTDDYSSHSVIKDLYIQGSYPTLETSIAFDYESYSSLFTNLEISGFYHAFYQRNTLERMANQTGNMYVNIHTRSCAKAFYFGNNDNTHNTDGYMSNITAYGLPALHIGSAAGWLINNMHVYGTVEGVTDPGVTPIYLRACGNTMLNNIYIEHYDVDRGIIAHVGRNVNISNVTMRTDDMKYAVQLQSGTSTTTARAVLTNFSLSGNDDIIFVGREHHYVMDVQASNVTCNKWYDEADVNYMTFKYGGFASKSGNNSYLFDKLITDKYSARLSGASVSITVPFTSNIDGILMVTSSHYGQGNPSDCYLGLFQAFKSKSYTKFFKIGGGDTITVESTVNDDDTITITATTTDTAARGELKLIV